VRRVIVGSRDHVALAGADPARFGADAERLAATGATLAYVAIDGVAAGLIAIADPPAPGARGAIAQLHALGVAPVMITGDREAAARWIAGDVGITDVHAGVRPTQKAAIVAALAGADPDGDGARRHVAMVGDGLNDAPALAAADLGIALGTGTDIAVAAADVTLLRGGITALPTVFALARATLHTIRRNLVAAFAYNLVCIPIAAAGLASPMIASAAMSLSSVSVLLSSLRLRRFNSATVRG
jgi:Cu+-exporting ATPase